MIGPYRLERVLGTGSFATVWLARDDVPDRNVAVKILADNWSRDDEVRRRFLSEARVLLTVESPRIVRGFHLGEGATGQPYLVMVWADRGTLGDRLDQRRREGRTFDANEVVGIATQVADALTDVHDSGHLHRDVKPTNVLIRSSSTRRAIPGLAADETIVLGDFGLACGLDLSALTLVAGSPGYVAPEQAAGLTQLDRSADLYSLGRIVLELLTGDPGGRATTMAGAASERIDVPRLMEAMPRRGISAPPPALVDLITGLVDENPAARPSTADELAAELEAVARSLASRGPRPPASPGAAQRTAAVPVVWCRRRTTAHRHPAGGAAPATPVDHGHRQARAGRGRRRPDATAVVGARRRDDGARHHDRRAGSDRIRAAGRSDGDAGERLRRRVADEELEPDRQTGRTVLDPAEFAEQLVDANPDWTGEPPGPDGAGNLEFVMTGPRTATVALTLEANSADPEDGMLTRYVIDYE